MPTLITSHHALICADGCDDEARRTAAEKSSIQSVFPELLSRRPPASAACRRAVAADGRVECAAPPAIRMMSAAQAQGGSRSACVSTGPPAVKPKDDCRGSCSPSRLPGAGEHRLRSAAKQPLPVAVVDLRAASVGLPTAGGWTPPCPTARSVPGRNSDSTLARTCTRCAVRRSRARPRRALVVARRHRVAAGGRSRAVRRARLRMSDKSAELTPPVVDQFRPSLWLELFQRRPRPARVTSEVSTPLTPASPTASIPVGRKRINYGGGARWFINDHLALNLDLRWHRLRLHAQQRRPGRQQETLIVAGGGISIK